MCQLTLRPASWLAHPVLSPQSPGGKALNTEHIVEWRADGAEGIYTYTGGESGGRNAGVTLVLGLRVNISSERIAELK